MEIGRRTLLAGALAAVAGGWTGPLLGQPAPPKPLEPPPLPPESERLTILRGYRPYRKNGPLLAYASTGSGDAKLSRNIIHNYGHGGGGITLAWGYAKDAADLAFTRRAAIANNQIVVLGAGIIGLTTAYAMLEKARQNGLSWRVSLFARDTPDGHGDYDSIVSSIAGGQFAPSITGLRDDDPQLRRRLDVSASTFLEHADWGVSRRPNFTLAEAPDLQLVDRIVNPRGTVPARLNRLPFRGVSCAGFSYETLLIEPPRYLRHLWRRLKSNANFTANERHLRSPRDLNDLPDTLIVNCMGLGASAITSEPTGDFFGREGQIIRYRPTDYDASRYPYLYSGIGYVFPRSDYVLIGGSVDGPGSGDSDKQSVTQDYGRAVVQVHREVFASRIPAPGAYPRAFSGGSRGARARCFA